MGSDYGPGVLTLVDLIGATRLSPGTEQGESYGKGTTSNGRPLDRSKEATYFMSSKTEGE